MKKILYFIPFIIICLFYGFIIFFLEGSFNSISAEGWILFVLLFISTILMLKNKWWGCILGLVYGIWLIYIGLQENGQIFKEWPIGIIFFIYYLICGLLVFKESKQ